MGHGADAVCSVLPVLSCSDIYERATTKALRKDPSKRGEPRSGAESAPGCAAAAARWPAGADAAAAARARFGEPRVDGVGGLARSTAVAAG
jgi:hypothetical protein